MDEINKKLKDAKAKVENATTIADKTNAWVAWTVLFRGKEKVEDDARKCAKAHQL